MRILHLSDPHFGAERPQAIAKLLACVQRLRPQLIVLSGDITQRARPEQFRAAARFVEQLPAVPVLTVPGNHDISLYNLPRRLLLPFTRYRKLFYPQIEPEVRYGDVEVIGFNSAPRWRHIDGELDLDAVRRRLEALPPRPALRICVFHHPLDCRRHQDQHNIIHRGAALAALLSQHRVDLVLGGHIHDPMMRTSAHRYPDLDYAMVLMLAGTCVSRRTRLGAPNSFNLVELQGEELLLQRWDWELDRPEFEPVLRTGFRRELGRGWVLTHKYRYSDPQNWLDPP